MTARAGAQSRSPKYGNPESGGRRCSAATIAVRRVAACTAAAAQQYRTLDIPMVVVNKPPNSSKERCNSHNVTAAHCLIESTGLNAGSTKVSKT